MNLSLEGGALWFLSCAVQIGYHVANGSMPSLHVFKQTPISGCKLRELYCTLIFYFETLQKFRCGLEF